MSASAILKPKMVRLGNIKIGGLGPKRKSRAGNDWRPPIKLPYFLVTKNTRDEEDLFVQDVMLMDELLAAGYGQKIDECEVKACGLKYVKGKRPEGMIDTGTVYSDSEYLRTIPCSAYVNNPDEILRVVYLWYIGQRCAGLSDGSTLKLWYDRKAKNEAERWLNKPIELPWDDKYKKATDGQNRPLFKMHSILNVVIRHRFATMGGVYQFRTTSTISSEQLFGSLLCLGDVIRGMPLKLVLKPMQVRPGGQEVTVFVAHIEMDGVELEQIKERILKNRAQLDQRTNEYRAMLAAAPVSGIQDEIEDAEIAQEFHPDQQPK